ncbi:hypothetical protein FK484_0079 [Listeria phage LP-031]|uniref:Uncharacterized protein n=1 Tax=Listeria phage LP-031 TaxID=2590049 RepID=A0A514U781_9CAUD|nr:hypothetical protein FK484_0079 [Listeria phage LP-031]
MINNVKVFFISTIILVVLLGAGLITSLYMYMDLSKNQDNRVQEVRDSAYKQGKLDEEANQAEAIRESYDKGHEEGFDAGHGLGFVDGVTWVHENE